MSKKRHSQNPYPFERLGSFGRFKSGNSFPIEYLQTTFVAEELEEKLTFARDVSPKEIDFELLMQRDIDEDRIAKKMVPYLSPKEKSAIKSKTIFFPPILVAALPIDKNEIQEYYPDELIDNSNSEIFIREWPGFFNIEYYKDSGPTSYQLESVVGDELTNESVDRQQVKMSFKLAIGAGRGTKLVVIDGQHRLYALQKVYENSPEILKDLVVPVCILFPPKATLGLQEDIYPNVIEVFRHLFVDVNTTMELVGGHFNILLADNSVGSLICRELCDHVLEERKIEGLSTLEWNTKAKKDSTIVKKDYALTSIGVIDKALKETLGHRKYKACFKYILGFPEIEQKLIQLSDTSDSDLAWDKFEHSQKKLITDQTKKYFVPSLYRIFYEAEPFKSVVGIFNIEFKKLNALANKDNEESLDAKAVIKYISQYIPLKDDSKYDNARKILKSFEQEIINSKIEKGIALSTYALFQRAVIDAWVVLLNDLRLTAIDVETATGIFIDILNFSTKDDMRLFKYDNEYIQFAIYSIKKVKVKNDVVKAIRNLILAALGNQGLIDLLEEKYSIVSKGTEFDLDIKEIGQTAASEYMEHYKKEKTKDFINTYSVNFDHLDEEDREELRKSHAKFDLEVREVRSGLRTRSELTKEFDELVETYVKNDIEIANNQLKKALGYDTDIVITGFNEENGDYETE